MLISAGAQPALLAAYATTLVSCNSTQVAAQLRKVKVKALVAIVTLMSMNVRVIPAVMVQRAKIQRPIRASLCTLIAAFVHMAMLMVCATTILSMSMPPSALSWRVQQVHRAIVTLT
jgi:hypothetical protein